MINCLWLLYVLDRVLLALLPQGSLVIVLIVCDTENNHIKVTNLVWLLFFLPLDEGVDLTKHVLECQLLWELIHVYDQVLVTLLALTLPLLLAGLQRFDHLPHCLCLKEHAIAPKIKMFFKGLVLIRIQE